MTAFGLFYEETQRRRPKFNIKDSGVGDAPLWISIYPAIAFALLMPYALYLTTKQAIGKVKGYIWGS